MGLNNIFAGKVRNEVSSWFHIVSGVKERIYMDHFDGLCHKEHGGGYGRVWAQIGK